MYPRKRIIQLVACVAVSVLLACTEEEPMECTDINGLSQQIGQMDVDDSFACAAEVKVLYEGYTINGLPQEQVTWAMTSRLPEGDQCVEGICREVSITLRNQYPNNQGIRLTNFEGTLKELMDAGYEIDLTYKTGEVPMEALAVDPCYDAENLFVSFMLNTRAEINGEVSFLVPGQEDRVVFWHTLAFRR